jgi:hypothetical protein
VSKVLKEVSKADSSSVSLSMVTEYMMGETDENNTSH